MFLVALFSVLTLSAAAQSNSIKGNVVDTSGQPVIGASVLVKGTLNGANTDVNGNFQLSNVPANATIEVSFVGYKTVETVAIPSKTFYNITMEEDSATLDEVVVVGYGVQKKSDVTGALTRVGAEELNTKPVMNAFEALQGKAAGVDITSNQRPGEIGSIRIRGNRSLNASNTPLYVVDGVPLSAGGIETLNPRDIESIDILKDASSTAIYGSRGANGVVLVTTKRGKTGQFNLNYSGTVTVESIKDLQPSMSAADMTTFVRWARHNATPDKYPNGDKPTYESDQEMFGATPFWFNIQKGWVNGVWDPSKVTDYDWEGLVTKTGITHEHTLSGSGGTENIQGSFSFGYLSNDGTQKGQEYQRYNFASTVDVTPKAWFKMGASINLSYTEQQYGFSRTGQSSNSGPTDIYGAAKALPHYALPYDEAGNLQIMPGGSDANAYTVMDEWTKSNDNRESFRALGSFYAQVDFGEIWKPLKGLSYKFAFGPDFRYRRNGIFIDASSAARAGSSNYVKWGADRYFSWTLDNMILYNRQFGKHNVGVTLLQSASKYNHENASMSGQNYPYPSMLWNNMGIIDIYDSSTYKAGMGTGFSENQLASYMARINYNFDERFLLTVSGRYDGSSVLAKGNKWAFFPSAAIGWRINQESWLRDKDWINNLKLRVGVGTTGNSAVDAYGTLGTVSQFYMPGNGANSSMTILAMNEPYYVDMSKSQNYMPNKTLGWEKTTQWNYGIDFGFFDNRIMGTIDIYHSHTKDLLMKATVPTLTGYQTMMANVGETKNFGIEFGVDFTPVRTKDFEWVSSINAAYQKDEIISLLNGKQDMIDNKWFIGQSIGVFYDYDNIGLWQDTPEDLALMEKYNANGHKFQPGMVRPVDQPDENGEIDYKINEKDRVILGNTTPRWTMGWSNTFTWKGLELAIELYGRMGYMISTGGEGLSGAANQRVVDYWTPDNPGADWQKPVYNSSRSATDGNAGLLGYKSASFLKVRNLSLGYNFPKSICNKIGFSSLKVYVQGRNLGNIYSSIDFIDLDLGTTYYNRGFTVGLNIGF